MPGQEESLLRICRLFVLADQRTRSNEWALVPLTFFAKLRDCIVTLLEWPSAEEYDMDKYDVPDAIGCGLLLDGLLNVVSLNGILLISRVQE